jgi:hypothetical protein
MTPCSVLKCPNAANEAVEPLLIVGPLCDGHRARVLAGEEYELQGALQALEGDQSRALGQRAHEILREALDAAEAVRTSAVTESQVAQRRKEDPDFVIDPIEWPV